MTKYSRVHIQKTLENESNFYNRVDLFANNFGGSPLRNNIFKGNLMGGYRIWTGSNGVAVYVRGIPVGEHDGFPLIEPISRITHVPQYVSSKLNYGDRIAIRSSQMNNSLDLIVVSSGRIKHNPSDLESFFCVMLSNKLV